MPMWLLDMPDTSFIILEQLRCVLREFHMLIIGNGLLGRLGLRMVRRLVADVQRI